MSLASSAKFSLELNLCCVAKPKPFLLRACGIDVRLAWVSVNITPLESTWRERKSTSETLALMK